MSKIEQTPTTSDRETAKIHTLPDLPGGRREAVESIVADMLCGLELLAGLDDQDPPPLVCIKWGLARLIQQGNEALNILDTAQDARREAWKAVNGKA